MRWDPATRYKLLLEINNAIISQTSQESFFQALAAKLGEYIPFDRVAINIYDPDNQSLSYFAAAQGIDPAGIKCDGSRPLAKGSIANLVIKTRQPVIIDDLSSYSDLETVGSMLAAGLRSTIALPLVVRGRLLGSIHFSFTSTPRHMDEMVEILDQISRQTAIGVDNMLAHFRLNELNQVLEREKRFLMSDSETGYNSHHFWYADPNMVDLVEQARLVAQTDASVLLTGETGTGKDLLARHIHLSGPRNKHLFVKVNCPALSASLFESELFGHSKGAFTGADKARVGRFEMAAGGTIFLDEIGELSVQLQAKMLQVLQDRSFERLGESRAIKTDLRIIAASNRDLEQAVKEGRFRQDLYYRLNAMRFHLPPLRERPQDIPLLLKKLTETESRRMNRPEPLYSPSAVELILAYHWPGNVRELKNLIMRLVIMRAGQTIAADDIQGLLAENPSSPPQGRVLPLAEMEKRLLEQALTQCRGVLGGVQGAAKLLGVPRSTLQYRIKKHTLDLAQFRK